MIAPTQAPASSKASGAIVSTSIVSTAPAEKHWTQAITDGDADPMTR